MRDEPGFVPKDPSAEEKLEALIIFRLDFYLPSVGYVFVGIFIEFFDAAHSHFGEDFIALFYFLVRLTAMDGSHILA